MTSSDWHRFAVIDNRGFDTSGLSLVMRDRESDGKVVAFVLGQTFGEAKPKSLRQVRDLIRKYPLLWDYGACVLPVIIRSYSKYFFGRGLWSAVQKRVARLSAGGTRAGYEGRGLGMRLRAEFVELARNRGFERIVVETISPATCHIWGKLGFSILGRKSWEDRRRRDGSVPFNGIEGDFAVHELILKSRPSRDFACLMLSMSSILGLCAILRALPRLLQPHRAAHAFWLRPHRNSSYDRCVVLLAFAMPATKGQQTSLSSS